LRRLLRFGYGPSRHFAAMQHFSRFRSEADMDRQAKRAGSG
jgi:hypothetical protein